MPNEFNFQDGRFLKQGLGVTPEDVADSLMESMNENTEEIHSVIVIMKRNTPDGDIFEVGYSTDSFDGIIGRLDIAKEIVKGKFFNG